MAKSKKVTRAGVEAGIHKGQVLLDDSEVRVILGRLPRTLTNMVQKGDRKLYRTLEVMNYVSTRSTERTDTRPPVLGADIQGGEIREREAVPSRVRVGRGDVAKKHNPRRTSSKPSRRAPKSGLGRKVAKPRAKAKRVQPRQSKTRA